MEKTDYTPEKGPHTERLMAMFPRFSLENQHFIFGMAKGILAAHDPTIGSIPAEFAKKRETK